MTWLRRLPLRARLTAAFTAVMSLLLAGISLSIYWSISSALLDEIDSGLRFRAAATASTSPGASIETPNPDLQERGEAFDQLVTSKGHVLRSSPGLPRTPVLRSKTLLGVRGPTFFERRVPGVVVPARLLVVRLPGPSTPEFLVVGTTMADRTDALGQLSIVLLAVEPFAIALASLAGWWVAGLALRPVERMRRQASAITASGLDRRLDLPVARDGLRRLATTLNDMLERLDTAAARDHRFLERASHELRTPLTALKAELDVASTGPRTVESLSAALESAREETDHLTRLANDLLVLARTRNGRLPVRREHRPLREFVETATAAHRSRATHHGLTLVVTAPETEVHIDPMRLRQALDNLLDNAFRHSSVGQEVRITAQVDDSILRLSVEDQGPGFAHDGEQPAPLEGKDANTFGSGGLGLRIARTVAVSHGGDLHTSNKPAGGALAVLTVARALPRELTTVAGVADDWSEPVPMTGE